MNIQGTTATAHKSPHFLQSLQGAVSDEDFGSLPPDVGIYQ